MERAIAQTAALMRHHEERCATEFFRCGVLPAYCTARIERHGEDVKRAYDSMRTERFGMFVKGPTGVGKTWLASALCAAMIYDAPRSYEPGDRLPRVEFTMARQLLRRLWETFRDGANETEGQAISHFTGLDLLVIDDLAHEGRVTPAGIGALHEILSVRLGNYRPTVVTSNLSLGEIATVYDSAIASRIGSFELVTLTGGDRR